MNNNEDYKKIALECAICKTRFEIWVAATNWFSPDFGDYLKENFDRLCPVCEALKDLEEGE